jgi:hypothetical protein
MSLKIVIIIVLLLIVMYLTDSFIYFKENFKTKILNLNINNTQSGGYDTNFITPYYGAWYGMYNYYYPRYPYFYNNYFY